MDINASEILSGNRIDADMLLLRSGVPSNLIGFDYLCDAVLLVGKNSKMRPCEVYAAVGEYRHVKPKTVMRVISYALNSASSLAKNLGKLTETTVDPNDVHNAFVIGYLATLLRAQLSQASAQSE